MSMLSRNVFFKLCFGKLFYFYDIFLSFVDNILNSIILLATYNFIRICIQELNLFISYNVVYYN